MTDYSYFMVAAPRTSAVRVFGKSMHTFAIGWIASVAWLWIAEIQQHVLRVGAAPPGYALSTLILGLIPAAMMAMVGKAINRWAGPAPDLKMERLLVLNAAQVPADLSRRSEIKTVQP